MTLETLQSLFEKIQNESSLENLMEHKFNLAMEIGKLHIRLHTIEFTGEKSGILASINAATTLESILNEKIEDVKKTAKENRKRAIEQEQQENKKDKESFRRYNIEESKLAMACKRVLNRSTYQAIIKVAQEMPHNQVKKLREKDLPMLILSVRDDEDKNTTLG